MALFLIIWFGQVISLIGSAMSSFALTFWAWQATGSATALALVGAFTFGSRVIFSPLAGALVDRWNRKLVIMLSDLASGLMTLSILALVSTGSLQIWHLCLTGFISGAFQAFQWPAFSASITLLVPSRHYSRAAALMSIAEWGSGVFAPILAGLLIIPLGLAGILLIDLATFIFALFTLILIRIPPPALVGNRPGQNSLLQDSVFGFLYIWQRKSLLWLQLAFFGGNFLYAFAGAVIAPMVLARTNNNSLILGSLESAAALGGIAGALVIIAWGGPKRRVIGVLGGWFLAGSCGLVVLGASQTFPAWLAGMFFAAFFSPIIDSCNQAIWQSRVAPEIQGRVFSARLLIAQLSGPLAMLAAGPLADQLMEPALATSQGALAGSFGWLTGTGPGAGMALMIVASGLLTLLLSIAGFLNPLVRNVESLLADELIING